ncbi:divergent polysaccharide deacetylase family protein [Ectothiorhodospiraceae bacterium WFHF3C12]|nr:divergent polysaccharide deacetylase family protein [Ectothiorhodospiraceae bacterium WFHF3C12]
MRAILAAVLLGVAAGTATADGAPAALVAVVIDDVGDRLEAGERTVDLPGPVACAFLPHTPHAERLAVRAHEQGKEVLLHQPMQAVTHNELLGPGAVTLEMTEPQFLRTLRENLLALPYVSGINNHMGSLLTRHPGHMTWLMEELQRQGGLYYIDSRTTHHTVAQRMADEVGVPAGRRHVFLDNRRDTGAIRAQFRTLVRTAKRQGYALAIGHPYPETLAVLEAEIPKLAEAGVRLVPVRTLLSASYKRRTEQWQASWSR